MGMHGSGGMRGGSHPGAGGEKIKERKYSDRELLSRLLKYITKYKGLLSISLICITITSAITAYTPLLIKEAIDTYIFPGDMIGLLNIAIIMMSLTLLSWFVIYGQMLSMGKMGQHVIYELREDLFHKLQVLSPAYYDKNESGQIISKVLNDVDSLSQILSSSIVQVLGNVLTIGGLLLIMFYLDVQLSLITLTVIPFMFVLALVFRKIFRKYFKIARKTIGKVTEVAQESILGISVSQSFNHQDLDIKKFSRANEAYTSAMVNVAIGTSWFFPTVEFIIVIGTALLIYYSGLGIFSGFLTLGIFIAFSMILKRFFRPLQTIANFYTEIQTAVAASERIFELLDEKPDIQTISNPKKIKKLKGKITFENVVFGYKRKVPVIHDISFTINPKETIALVGYTGGGKTTHGNLLTRFYDTWKGEVKFDDVNIAELDLDWLQKQIAVVLQEPFLFAESIRNNIKFGKPEATDNDIWEVLKIVGLKDFVESLPEGLDTNVYERGVQLSNGQKQLVSFARALITDPPILILDEATSSVDLYTESLIQQALEELLKNRTSVVIAHRLSTIKNASRIFVIDEGKLVDVGTHEQLVKREGIYRDLYKIQFKDAIPDLKDRKEETFSKKRKDVKIKQVQAPIKESDFS
ncbi:MAG: ABC transporter ATP-binding protein [Candidatus Ranarchaeia archaeon]